MDFVILIQAKKKGEKEARWDTIKRTGERNQVLINALAEAKSKWPESEGFAKHKASLNK